MEKLKVKVNNETESKEVQRLFFELGYEMGACSIGFYPVVIITTKSWGTENWCSTRAIGLNHPAHENHKEITLQELRDMVVLKRNSIDDASFKDNFGDKWYIDSENFYWMFECGVWRKALPPKFKLKPIKEEVMKEYLDPDNGYDFIKWTGFAHPPESFIEIPEGVNLYARCNIFGDYRWLTKIIDGDWEVLWQRESLNNKIATAEVARQESKSIDATLAERQSQYGCFEDVAFVTENIMATLAKVRSNGLQDLPHTHRMALYMIASKMARIVNGDFNHLDSWHDIGGYSKLIEDLIGDGNEI